VARASTVVSPVLANIHVSVNNCHVCPPSLLHSIVATPEPDGLSCAVRLTATGVIYQSFKPSGSAGVRLMVVTGGCISTQSAQLNATSTAPASHPLPCGRASPRATTVSSVPSLKVQVAAFSTTLFAPGSIVLTAPPLSASGCKSSCSV